MTLALAPAWCLLLVVPIKRTGTEICLLLHHEADLKKSQACIPDLKLYIAKSCSSICFRRGSERLRRVLLESAQQRFASPHARMEMEPRMHQHNQFHPPDGSTQKTQNLPSTTIDTPFH